MRGLTYLVATSLDGFIADPDGGASAFLMQGDHIDALFREYPETMPAPALAAMGLSPELRTFDTVVMGFATYSVGLRAGLASPYPHLAQYVCTHDHASHRAEGVEVHAGDPVALIRRLKAQPSSKDVWLCGGGSLAGALIDTIDRLVLKVHPVVLGDGIRMFAGRSDGARKFRLAGTRRFETGVVMNEYVRR